MITLRPARSALLFAALAVLSGCATGSSLSIAQAPLSFVLTDDGAYEIAAEQDGTAQALAEAGTPQTGVPGYAVIGGNALLPVSAIAPNPVLSAASSVGPNLGPSLISATVAPGQVAVAADLAGQVKLGLSANLPALSSVAVPGALPSGVVAAPATAALAPVTSALAPVTSVVAPIASAPLTASVALPAPTAIVAPVATAANQSLTAVTSVLGSVAPPATVSAGGPANPVLATIAAALGRRCC